MRSKDVGEQNKFKILSCLAGADIDGKSVSEICREIGLHRDTVHSLCRELINAGLIVKRRGKSGRYRLTEQALGDPGLVGWAFAKGAFKQILRKGNVTSSGCKYSALSFDNVATVTDREIECRLLFDCALLVGVYQMYTYLKAFEPAIMRTPSRVSRKQQKISVSGRHKDELAMRWVNNAIQPYAMLVQSRRLKFIRRKLRPHDSSTDLSWGFNVMTEANYKRLMSEFAEVFGGVFGLLEKEMEKALAMKDRYKKYYLESIAESAAKKRK
jgi:hypothetical protein